MDRETQLFAEAINLLATVSSAVPKEARRRSSDDAEFEAALLVAVRCCVSFVGKAKDTRGVEALKLLEALRRIEEAIAQRSEASLSSAADQFLALLSKHE